MSADPREGQFDLFDLRVEWQGDGPCWCKARPGDHFELHGEQLQFPAGQSWSIYTMAALLPILPAKQRPCHANDWMSTDARVACPDPNCKAHFLIRRIGTRTFNHADVTAVPLPSDLSSNQKK